MSEIDPRVRALYYMFLVGGPWKFDPCTTDAEAWAYLREISGIVYDGIGDVGIDGFMIHMDGDQIASVIIQDLIHDKLQS